MFKFLAISGSVPARGGARRPTRRTALAVNPLENRALLSTVPVITEAVSPQTLWPPNGRLVPVRVSGTIVDPVAPVNSVVYTVGDSEAGGQILSGPVSLVNGRYSFVVRLQARRAGQDFNGRQYSINVIATDSANNVNSDTMIVTVPHDQGHRPFGSGSGFGGGGNFGVRPGHHPHRLANRPVSVHTHHHGFPSNPGPFLNQNPGGGHGHGNGNGNGHGHQDQGNSNAAVAVQQGNGFDQDQDNGNGNGNGHDNGNNGNGNGNGHDKH